MAISLRQALFGSVLPGTVVGSATPQRPAQFQLVQQEAARVGYHVVGLMYVNSGGIAQTCPADPDPATCYENARVEVVDGIDRRPIVGRPPQAPRRLASGIAVQRRRCA